MIRPFENWTKNCPKILKCLDFRCSVFRWLLYVANFVCSYQTGLRFPRLDHSFFYCESFELETYPCKTKTFNVGESLPWKEIKPGPSYFYWVDNLALHIRYNFKKVVIHAIPSIFAILSVGFLLIE